jgi:hypothetical protein
MFSNGVQIGSGGSQQPVAMEDLRDHWANKDEPPSGDGLMEPGSMMSNDSSDDKAFIPKK